MKGGDTQALHAPAGYVTSEEKPYAQNARGNRGVGGQSSSGQRQQEEALPAV